MNAQFLQFHLLTSYPAALLNRDDAGFAKRIPFGGVTRTRISSQCLKRHWRTFQGEHALAELEVPPSIRSRHTFERLVVRPLIAEGMNEAVVREVTAGLISQVLGESAKARKTRETAEAAPAEGLVTGQVTVLGRPEVDYLLSLAREVCASVSDVKEARKAAVARFDKDKDQKKNLRALGHAAGLEAALFGRMVTSDILARTDAAVHVAHAFTVHEETSESDYFSAVDELLREGDDRELGSGHINSSELASGLYYSFVVVDVPHLVSNLTGCQVEEAASADRSLAAGVVERLIYLMSTVSPGAKVGSTAPYACAHLVLVETGRAQPRSLANAFLRPVPQRRDLLGDTYEALARHIQELDRMYGAPGERCLAGIGPLEALLAALGQSEAATLAQAATFAADAVRRG